MLIKASNEYFFISLQMICDALFQVIVKINKISFQFCSIGSGSINNGPIKFESYAIKALLWEDEQWVSRSYLKVSKLVSETYILRFLFFYKISNILRTSFFLLINMCRSIVMMELIIFECFLTVSQIGPREPSVK